LDVLGRLSDCDASDHLARRYLSAVLERTVCAEDRYFGPNNRWKHGCSARFRDRRQAVASREIGQIAVTRSQSHGGNGFRNNDQDRANAAGGESCAKGARCQ